MEKIEAAIPICEKKTVRHTECIHTCTGVYPCLLTSERLGKDEDSGILCVSKTQDGKWVNFCLWKGKEDPVELVVRFSVPYTSSNQFASILLSQGVADKKS